MGSISTLSLGGMMSGFLSTWLVHANAVVKSTLLANSLFGLRPRRPTFSPADSYTRVGTLMSLRRGPRRSRAATFSRLDSLASLLPKSAESV